MWTQLRCLINYVPSDSGWWPHDQIIILELNQSEIINRSTGPRSDFDLCSEGLLCTRIRITIIILSSGWHSAGNLPLLLISLWTLTISQWSCSCLFYVKRTPPAHTKTDPRMSIDLRSHGDKTHGGKRIPRGFFSALLFSVIKL